MQKYSLIAAIADNLVIGKENRIPWHLSEDLKLFKRLTTGNIVIMGRKTFDSIGKPLPNRTSIVITGTPDRFSAANSAAGLFAVSSFEAALEKAGEIAAAGLTAETGKQPAVFVAGGASIYTQTIDGAEKLYLSRIPGSFEGDTYFPDFRNSSWRLDSTEELTGFRLEVYRRK